MIIDLCSGYGGATQAFNEEIIKLDITSKVKPDIVADVRSLPLREKIRPSLLWLSPPCTFMSYAHQYIMPGIRENLDIVGACLEAVPHLEPKNWILENPRGRLQKYIGPPRASISYYAKRIKGKKHTHLWSNVDSLKRAFIPYEISKKISDFLD